MRVGRPQGGFLSTSGQAAYWRMKFESNVGALADLIAEHNETLAEMERLQNENDKLRDRVDQLGADPETSYLNVRETAKMLGVHENTVRTMCHDGRLEYTRMPGRGRYLRIPLRAVLRVKPL